MVKQWPNLTVHFILNDAVSYLRECPYQVHLCHGSPTKNTSRVKHLMQQIQPDLVVFDASGRASQFKQAKSLGAKVTFISQHDKKRTRGLKLNRLFHTDIHWVAQASFCMKKLSAWQKLKLKFFHKPTPKIIGPVFDKPNQQTQELILIKNGIKKGEYLLFNAGSGGHMIGTSLAADIYYQAAKVIHKQTGLPCMVIFGSNYPNVLPEAAQVTCIKNVDNGQFISLLNNAGAGILSAGDTLLQSISLSTPCVSSPVSRDQPARLESCHHLPQVFAAKSNVESLVQQTLLMLNQYYKSNQSSVKKHAEKKLALQVIIDDIAKL